MRDLRLNNDHIHIVEQRMRKAIEQGLSVEGHDTSSVKCFPTYVRFVYYTRTKKGGYLEKKFCKLFSKSSTVVFQLPCRLGKQRELSEKCSPSSRPS